jgi:hypothetical protein
MSAGMRNSYAAPSQVTNKAAMRLIVTFDDAASARVRSSELSEAYIAHYQS